MQRDRMLFGVALVLGALVGGALVYAGSPIERTVGGGNEHAVLVRIDNVGPNPIGARVELRDADGIVETLIWSAPPGRSERTALARLGDGAFAWGRFSGSEGSGDHILAFSPQDCPRGSAVLVGWELDGSRGMGVRGQTVGCRAE